MARINLEEWLTHEATPVNAALDLAMAQLPAACQPVARHILNAGGKRMRPLLTVLCARLFGNTDPAIHRLAASMEMLHAATLLHDDVLDNAATRRGRPAAHTIFGVAPTILAGDSLLAHGNAIVASYEDCRLTLCYSKATSQTAAGEILEMGSLRDPGLDLERYMEIARGKTACLIAQSCAMGALFASADAVAVSQCESFGENLGLAFQIVDDALDFAPEEQTGKPSGGDLREGKMTPPISFYRESLNEGDRLAFDKAFSTSSFSASQFKPLVTAINSFAGATLALADSCLEKARKALALLPPGKENQILREMTDYVRSRHK